MSEVRGRLLAEEEPLTRHPQSRRLSPGGLPGRPSLQDTREAGCERGEDLGSTRPARQVCV